jgi:hypothetical protein
VIATAEAFAEWSFAPPAEGRGPAEEVNLKMSAD